VHIEKNNIFLVGPLGAGKTTVGRMISESLGMEFWDSDCEIERRTGVDLAWIFDVEGEASFRKREIAAIDDLTQKQGIVLATGGGSVLEEASRRFLVSRGYVIYLRTSIVQQMIRTEHDSSRRPMLLDKGDDKESVLEDMRRIRAPLYEEVADYVFDMEGVAVTTAVKQLIAHLRAM
jgi:shikimate kinase